MADPVCSAWYLIEVSFAFVAHHAIGSYSPFHNSYKVCSSQRLRPYVLVSGKIYQASDCTFMSPAHGHIVLAPDYDVWPKRSSKVEGHIPNLGRQPWVSEITHTMSMLPVASIKLGEEGSQAYNYD